MNERHFKNGVIAIVLAIFGTGVGVKLWSDWQVRSAIEQQNRRASFKVWEQMATMEVQRQLGDPFNFPAQPGETDEQRQERYEAEWYRLYAEYFSAHHVQRPD
jgi:hypothetical protein